MDKKHIFEPPYFDLRVITLILCAFLSGLYTAAHMNTHLTAHGSGSIIIPLAVAILRYTVLASVSIAAHRLRVFIALLLIYDAVCAVVFGFFTYAFFTANTVVLLSVVLPMLIYCYVMTVFSSAALLPKNDIPFAKNENVMYNEDRFFRILMCRWRLIAFAVLLEGVIAPCI